MKVKAGYKMPSRHIVFKCDITNIDELKTEEGQTDMYIALFDNKSIREWTVNDDMLKHMVKLPEKELKRQIINHNEALIKFMDLYTLELD